MISISYYNHNENVFLTNIHLFPGIMSIYDSLQSDSTDSSHSSEDDTDFFDCPNGCPRILPRPLMLCLPEHISEYCSETSLDDEELFPSSEDDLWHQMAMMIDGEGQMEEPGEEEDVNLHESTESNPHSSPRQPMEYQEDDYINISEPGEDQVLLDSVIQDYIQQFQEENSGQSSPRQASSPRQGSSARTQDFVGQEDILWRPRPQPSPLSHDLSYRDQEILMLMNQRHAQLEQDERMDADNEGDE